MAHFNLADLGRFIEVESIIYLVVTGLEEGVAIGQVNLQCIDHTVTVVLDGFEPEVGKFFSA